MVGTSLTLSCVSDRDTGNEKCRTARPGCLWRNPGTISRLDIVTQPLAQTQGSKSDFNSALAVTVFLALPSGLTPLPLDLVSLSSQGSSRGARKQSG